MAESNDEIVIIEGDEEEESEELEKEKQKKIDGGKNKN